MAIDSTEKKLSLLNLGVPWYIVLPEADGAIDQGDRQHLLNLYSGIEFASVIAIFDLTLYPRSLILTLEDRATILTLDERSTALTLEDQ